MNSNNRLISSQTAIAALTTLQYQIAYDDLNHPTAEQAMQSFLRLAIIISLADKHQKLVNETTFRRVLQAHLLFKQYLKEYLDTPNPQREDFTPLAGINHAATLIQLLTAKHTFLYESATWIDTHKKHLQTSISHLTAIIPNEDIVDMAFYLLATEDENQPSESISPNNAFHATLSATQSIQVRRTPSPQQIIYNTPYE
jgi:hypothetical protein